MSKLRPFIGCTLLLFTLILLHDPLMIGISNTLTLFREDNRIELLKNTYEKEIDNLTKKISEYETSLNDLKIHDFNSHILGKIAVRNIYNFYDYLYINIDSKVKEGSAVLNEDGLVGIIDASNQKTAKVKLLTGDIDLSVKIGNVYGILNGHDKKTGELIIHNIDNYKNIEENEKVYTSGLQSIDENLYIGTVSRVIESGVEKIVYVKPSVDFDVLNYLVVLSK